ncbi:hypothetical protein DOY81_011255 [Sarcophaga bullata]|nr:hypothetical protein DOY81_011255 [Sarcophaga bullata]
MSIMVETENEKFMEDTDTNHFSDTTQSNEEELDSKVIYSDHFNDSSLDIKDNEVYMECSTEPEILQEQLIFEKVNIIKIDEKKQRREECFLKSGAAKDTPVESKDSPEKNKKQSKDADNITGMLRQLTNKSFTKEKNNLSAKEDNSNLIFSDDQEVEKANTAQHTKTDFSIRKIDPNNRKEATKEHDRIIAKYFKIKCDLCQIPLENFMALREHFEVEHKQCGYVRCCKRTLHSRASLVEHLYGHIKPDYLKCKVCDKVYKSRYNLIAHSRTHGDKSELLKCDKCSKSFTTPSILKHHIESVHQNKFVQICEICGKSLRCLNSFEQHMKNHVPTTEHVSCDICGKLYVNVKGLKRHKRCQHSEGGKKYHKCDVCGQLLYSAQSLKRHKLAQHPEGGKKEEKCPICSKVASNPIALKQHIIDIHEKGYIHKCTMCDRAFTRARFLKEHLARHTGTALYSCNWCPKTFTTNCYKYLHHKKAHPEEWEEHLRQLNAKKYNK